jgi:hypothetical protein
VTEISNVQWSQDARDAYEWGQKSGYTARRLGLDKKKPDMKKEESTKEEQVSK